jgi:CheY-like chemotaxis protein
MQKNFSILLAEDNAGHVALIKKNLARMGFKSKIMVFNDGQEALDFLFQRGSATVRDPQTTYLLLLDIRMPKVDGITVLERIKSSSELCDMPVIMLTSSDEEAEIRKCYELGCSDYIVKPVKYESFAEIIERKVSASLLMSIVELSDISKEPPGTKGEAVSDKESLSDKGSDGGEECPGCNSGREVRDVPEDKTGQRSKFKQDKHISRNQSR